MSHASRTFPASATLSLGAKVSVLALTVLGLVGGWMIVLAGGFSTETYRRSGVYTFVNGESAALMATIEFMMAAIGVAAMLKSSGFSRTTVWLGVASVLVPPMAIAWAI